MDLEGAREDDVVELDEQLLDPCLRGRSARRLVDETNLAVLERDAFELQILDELARLRVEGLGLLLGRRALGESGDDVVEAHLAVSFPNDVHLESADHQCAQAHIRAHGLEGRPQVDLEDDVADLEQRVGARPLAALNGHVLDLGAEHRKERGLDPADGHLPAQRLLDLGQILVLLLVDQAIEVEEREERDDARDEDRSESQQDLQCFFHESFPPDGQRRSRRRGIVVVRRSEMQRPRIDRVSIRFLHFDSHADLAFRVSLSFSHRARHHAARPRGRRRPCRGEFGAEEAPRRCARSRHARARAIDVERCLDLHR